MKASCRKGSMHLCWVHRDRQRTILQTIESDVFWKSRSSWMSRRDAEDAAHLCVTKMQRMLDNDSPQLRDRGHNIFDIPWPPQLKSTKDALWKRLDAALDKKYRLLSSRVIINAPGSTGQKVHRDIDIANTPPVVVIFMLPLVDVTKERAPTEIKTIDGSSVLQTCGAGVPYAFDGHARHRGTANTSREVRPALVFDCCLKGFYSQLKKDPLYK